MCGPCIQTRHTLGFNHHPLLSETQGGDIINKAFKLYVVLSPLHWAENKDILISDNMDNLFEAEEFPDSEFEELSQSQSLSESSGSEYQPDQDQESEQGSASLTIDSQVCAETHLDPINE